MLFAPWSLCTQPSPHPFVHSPDWAPCLTVLRPPTGSALTSFHSDLTCPGDRMPDKGNLQMAHGGVDFGSQSEGTAHQGGEDMGAGDRGSNFHSIHSQCRLPVCSPFYSVQAGSHGLPTRGDFPSSIKTSGNTLTDMPGGYAVTINPPNATPPQCDNPTRNF